MEDAALAYRRAFFDALKPPPNLSVSEWADTSRILTAISTPEPGRWRTSRSPHLKEPMDLLSPQETKINTVILMFGAQGLSKTECGLNFLGHCIDINPGPFMIMYPDKEFAKAQVLQRIKPMLEACPSLAAQVDTSNPRDAGNSMFLKLFKSGMMLRIIGGHSGSATQGNPIRYLWVDEASSLPLEAGGQGDPLANARARQSNFQNRKTLLTSTPGVRGLCRITKEYEAKSDQRRRYLTVPCCHSEHILLWKDFVWDTPHGEVFWQCPSCGERVAEYYKTTMLANGRWVSTAIGDGRTAGFHLPGWYAPRGFVSWEEIRDEFLQSKNDREVLIGWVQKRAADPWEEDTSVKFSTDDLKARRFDTSAGNGYADGVVPDGVVLITIGADVQGGRGTLNEGIHVHVWGWGAGEECWHLGHIRLAGDPSRFETLDQLDTVATSTWRRQDGAELGMSLGAIDEGGNVTEEVRRWCAARVGRWVPVKGDNRPDAPIIGPGRGVMFNRHDRAATRAGDVQLYRVGYVRSIDLLQNRLKILQPGPGYVHLGAAATDDLVAELFPWRYLLVQKAGLVSHTWILPAGQHDEMGDCLRYGYGAMELIRRRRFAANRDQMWEHLAADALATIGPAPAAVNDHEPNGRAWLPKDRKGWLSR